MIMCEDELSLELLHNLSAERLGPIKALERKKASLNMITQTGILGNVINGLCLDRLDSFSIDLKAITETRIIIFDQLVKKN